MIYFYQYFAPQLFRQAIENLVLLFLVLFHFFKKKGTLALVSHIFFFTFNDEIYLYMYNLLTRSTEHTIIFKEEILPYSYRYSRYETTLSFSLSGILRFLMNRLTLSRSRFQSCCFALISSMILPIVFRM